jgi:hypothetical protein
MVCSAVFFRGDVKFLSPVMFDKKCRFGLTRIKWGGDVNAHRFRVLDRNRAGTMR